MWYLPCRTRLASEVVDVFGFLRQREYKMNKDEEECDRRLVEAEKSLGHLQHRAHVAMQYLDGRHHRNHWRESVQEMIQGGHKP